MKISLAYINKKKVITLHIQKVVLLRYLGMFVFDVLGLQPDIVKRFLLNCHLGILD